MSESVENNNTTIEVVESDKIDPKVAEQYANKGNIENDIKVKADAIIRSYEEAKAKLKMKNKLKAEKELILKKKRLERKKKRKLAKRSR